MEAKKPSKPSSAAADAKPKEEKKKKFKVKQVEKYVITESLGAGVNGVTFKCYHIDDPNKLYCAKQVMRDELEEDISVNKLFEREVLLLRMLKNPYIVRIHDIIKSASSFYLIMEYCNGGSLAQLVQRRGFLTEKEAHYCIQQVMTAFLYLFEKNVIHRDLKPANIMINFPDLPEKRMPRKIF